MNNEENKKMETTNATPAYETTAQKTYRLANEKQQQVVAKLVAKLRATGHEVDDKLRTVDGRFDVVEVNLERSNGSMFRYSGKLRVVIGTYGDKTNYPEPKAGFDYDKLLIAYENWVARRTTEQARNAAKQAKAATARAAATAINQELGLKEYGPLRATANEYGNIKVDVDIGFSSPEKAKRVLAAIQAALAAEVA